VLEIGAGVGNLTCELAKTAGRVIASENDRQMLTILKTVLIKLIMLISLTLTF